MWQAPCLVDPARLDATMTQRNVETTLGRLLTDDELRGRFLEDPSGTLEALVASGIELTGVEIAALAATEPGLLRAGAVALDPRILKVTLADTKER